VQLHHKFYPKKLASFEVRSLKGTEIAKWARLAENGAIDAELRALELLISEGKFHSEEFIIAEREGRLIGRLRARWVEGASEGTVLLEQLAVIEGFEFIEVAQELITCGLERVRANPSAKQVRTRLNGQDEHNEELRRLYEHWGFSCDGNRSLLQLAL
jgi:hypothetical protein